MKQSDLKTLKNMLGAKRVDNSSRHDDPTFMLGGWGKGSGRYHSECREIRALERAIKWIEGRRRR